MDWSKRVSGIDVARYQKTVNWPVVARGQAFAYLKATEGGTYTDPTFARNAKGATAAGIAWGAYHYARPDTRRGTVTADAETEALHLVSKLRGTGWSLPPALDFEHRKPTPAGSGLSRAQTAQWLAAFARTIRRELGVKPVLYSSRTYLRETLGKGGAAKLRPLFSGLWQARYPGGGSDPAKLAKPRPVQGWPWDIWQWTGKGRTPGVATRVDLNVTDSATLNRLRGARRLPASRPPRPGRLARKGAPRATRTPRPSRPPRATRTPRPSRTPASARRRPRPTHVAAVTKAATTAHAGWPKLGMGAKVLGAVALGWLLGRK